MASFKLNKEIEKDVFCLVTSEGLTWSITRNWKETLTVLYQWKETDQSHIYYQYYFNQTANHITEQMTTQLMRTNV